MTFLDELVARPDAPFQLVHPRTGRLLATRLETAFDSKARNRGLLGREGLAPGSALILAPCNTVHTFFMRFPIDVLFVGRDGRVVKVCRHVKPWRVAAAVSAFATVEFAAGELATHELSASDTVKLQTLDTH